MAKSMVRNREIKNEEEDVIESRTTSIAGVGGGPIGL